VVDAAAARGILASVVVVVPLVLLLPGRPYHHLSFLAWQEREILRLEQKATFKKEFAKLNEIEQLGGFRGEQRAPVPRRPPGVLD